MKKLLLAGVAAGAFFGAPALAADLPTKAPAYIAAPAPMLGWTGFYAGIGLGARWMDSAWTTTAAFDPGGGALPFSTDPNATFSGATFRISGYAGYNWQVASVWVVGIEGDFGWADNHDTLGSRIPGLGVLSN